MKKLFLSGTELVTDLKLTAGWGKAGRENSIPYELLHTCLASYPEAVPGTAIYYDGLGRISSSEWNLALQSAFWNGRISLSAKYYQKTSVDTFDLWFFGKHSGNFWTWAREGEVLLSESGQLSNSGFEFDAETQILRSENISWTLRGNLSINRNDVDGLSAATISGFRENADASPMDLNGDGILSDSDKVPLGFAIPKVYGGFGTSLSVHRFSLDLLFDGAAGHQIANLSRLCGDGKQYLSSSYIENGDYLRLSRLSFRYDVPLRWSWIKSFNLSLSATNLFTVSNYSGWNPDVNSYGTSAGSAGSDYGSFPISRSLILGISAKF